MSSHFTVHFKQKTCLYLGGNVLTTGHGASSENNKKTSVKSLQDFVLKLSPPGFSPYYILRPTPRGIYSFST